MASTLRYAWARRGATTAWRRGDAAAERGGFDLDDRRLARPLMPSPFTVGKAEAAKVDAEPSMPAHLSPTFGRRTASAPAASVQTRSLALSEAAERFKADLAREPERAPDGFSAWRRGRGAARAAAWLATFALLTPGVLCFVLQAPTGVSLAVEGLGMAANWWLRRQRRAHLAAIRDWSPQGD